MTHNRAIVKTQTGITLIIAKLKLFAINLNARKQSETLKNVLEMDF